MLFCPEKGLGVMLQSIREFADDARRSQKKTLINLVKSLLMVSSPGKIIIFCRQRRETKTEQFLEIRCFSYAMKFPKDVF